MLRCHTAAISPLLWDTGTDTSLLAGLESARSQQSSNSQLRPGPARQVLLMMLMLIVGWMAWPAHYSFSFVF
jgi:hypothetical protein